MLESAVLPIGGKGRRMKSFSNIPKLIIKLNGKPLIERTLEKLSSEGIKKIFLISNNESSKIEHYCAEVCEKLSLTLKVLKENKYKGFYYSNVDKKLNKLTSISESVNAVLTKHHEHDGDFLFMRD